MTLRRKIAIIIAASIGGLLLVIYLLARVILLASFEHLEQDDTRRNLERAVNALGEELDHLTATTTDWAYWDDTYTFIQGENADYVEANLIDEVFVNLSLNLALYVDPSGKIVFSKAFDLDHEQEIPLSAGLNNYLSPDGLLLSNADSSSLRRGIIVLDDGPMLVVARPILTSAKQGPSGGTLIFGYRLDEAWIARLAESNRVSLAMRLWDDRHLSADFRIVRTLLSGQSPTVIRTLGDNSIAGYTLMTDINGHPALILRADFPRRIYAHGWSTLTYFMILMLGLLVFVGVVLLLLLEKTVLAKTQMGTLLEHSSDVIILTHPDGTIKRVNPAFKRMFNGMAQHFDGQPLSVLFDAKLDPPLTDILHTVVEKREGQQVDVSVQNKAQNQVEASMVLSPIWRGNGRVSEVFCSLRDITAQKRLEEQLRKTLAREMELNDLKSRLISIVSHELRTPLATIQLANEALAEYADRLTDERKQEKRYQIKSAIQRMVFLLEDIVTLNRAESGKLKLELLPFDLVSLCQTIVDNIRVSIRHNLTFSLSNDDACSEVCMDQRLVQLIVSNLLSNAAKYSPPGHTVYLDLKCEGEESVIQVRDEGIGIPPEEQRRLFEPFFRAGNVGAVTGTGLGLTIVKQAVEAHKGTITFESQIGVGTTFTLRIPNKVKGGCE